MQYAKLWLHSGELVENASGVVATPIVDRDDLEIRVVLLGRVLQGFPDNIPFVVARNHQCSFRPIVQFGRLVGPWRFALQTKKIIDAAEYPK
jgi:hypothetical protein